MRARTTVRDAVPEDNPALVALAAACPMRGDISLRVDRRPDFFALNRLAGDPWWVGVVDGGDGPAGCVAIARRRVYLDGRAADVAYVGDLKVHPVHRGRGVARALAGWAQATVRELVGEGPALGTVLAGNGAVDRLLGTLTPAARHRATIRSYSLQLLWPRRLPRTGLSVELAGPEDVPEMAILWRRLAGARQFAPVDGWFATPRPGLDYLVARRGNGALAGFVGLWDQHDLKQLRVTGYSPRLALARTAFNALAPVARAPRLPPSGGELRYRTAVNLCVPDARTLRTLLRHAHERLRGAYSFLLVGLDVRDPLQRALDGMRAQRTDVALLVRGGAAEVRDDRPAHFEVATV